MEQKPMNPEPANNPAFISVRNLNIGYGDRVVQENLNFDIQKNDIFFVIGGSGCGKTTLLKHMTGLIAPTKCEVLYAGVNSYHADEQTKLALLQRWGITYQSG